MIAIGLWAMPRMSRITPPTPVFAPPNGSTAEGWLWVSALSASVVPWWNSTTPALPTNADRTNGARDGIGAGAQLLHQRWTLARFGVSGLDGVDDRPEGLVGTVFAPGLSQRLDFDVGGIAVEGGEVVADHPQLLGVERERAIGVDARRVRSSSRPRIVITSAGPVASSEPG